MDKEGDILDRDSCPNKSPDRVKEGEKGRIIGQNPKAEVAPFSSTEIGMKNAVFRTEVEEAEPGFRTAVRVTGCIETVTEFPEKSGKNLGQVDN